MSVICFLSEMQLFNRILVITKYADFLNRILVFSPAHTSSLADTFSPLSVFGTLATTFNALSTFAFYCRKMPAWSCFLDIGWRKHHVHIYLA